MKYDMQAAQALSEHYDVELADLLRLAQTLVPCTCKASNCEGWKSRVREGGPQHAELWEKRLGAKA